MADNLTITQGSGTTIAADEIASTKYQRIKLIHGIDGVNDGDAALANGYPVGGSQASNMEALMTKVYTFFTGSYQSLAMSNIATCRALVVWNDTDQAVLGSWDAGATAHWIIPAKASRVLQVKSGATQLHVKYDSAMGSGNCYFEVYR